MVEGMTMLFSAEKMIKALEEDGRTFEEIKAMDDVLNNLKRLDGCEVTSQCWKRVVKGESVYFVDRDKFGNIGEYVPDSCCVYPSEFKECERF